MSDDRRCRRLLLVSSRNSYRSAAYISAAVALGLELVIASNSEAGLPAAANGGDGIRVSLQDTDDDLALLLDSGLLAGIGGVVATDDRCLELAAAAAAECKLPHNPPHAVRTSQDKHRARLCQQDAGCRVPPFLLVQPQQRGVLRAVAERVGFPCVVKPTTLAASQGVIRSDDKRSLACALDRVCKILREQGLPERDILVERFIPGLEVALEGLLHNGELIEIALFDKPEPLDGPYFEESIYTSPSRLPLPLQREVSRVTLETCRAHGLWHGPVHAECRINDDGVWPLEVAARTIGGECARLFALAGGHTLESMVLQNALGSPPRISKPAAGIGVLMLPVAEGGVLQRVEGVGRALAVPGIVDVRIHARDGQLLRPWPEGASYPGFVFALAASPALAEQALREAGDCIRLVVRPLLPVRVVRGLAGGE